MINETDGVIEIQRNELANYFARALADNYVIGTRFTTDRGYYVESRRGGGGYIKIKRVNVDRPKYLMHIVVDGRQDFAAVREVFINNFVDYESYEREWPPAERRRATRSSAV